MNVPFRLTRRRLVVLALLTLLLVPLFLPVPVDWRQHPLVGTLGDRVHVVMFAILVLMLHGRGPLRGRPLAAVAASIAIGGLTELAQSLAGRSTSSSDWYQDIQGAVLAGCWIWWRNHDGRAVPLVLAALVLVAIWWPMRDLPALVRESLAAARRFPLLCDFERRGSLVLWDEHLGSRLTRVAVGPDDHALEVRHDGDERWPGTSSSHLAWNWTGQDTLLIDARLVAPAPDSLGASIWILDRAGARDVDDARRAFTLDHRWRTLRVPLADLRTLERGRPLVLRNVVSLSVYLHRRAAGPLAVQIDDVRLVSAPGDTRD
jgi:hypothetical protein